VMVTPAQLTVTATGVNKPFDGTTNATVTLSDNRLQFAADTFTDGYTSASFANIGPGSGITVNVSGVFITGPGAGNYVLTSTTATTTANIDSIDLTTLTPNGTPTYTPTINGTALLFTNATNETTSAWLPATVPVSQSFTTSFTFNITGITSPLADGFAFVIQTNGPAALGTPGMGGFLGYTGITNSIAIEFDTYNNGGPGFNDPACSNLTCAHIGIQSNGMGANSPDHASLAALAAPVLIDLTGTHTAKITYDGTSTLSVYLDGNLVVSALNVNLSTLLPLSGGTNAYVGFTAATGDASELTDLLSWTWN